MLSKLPWPVIIFCITSLSVACNNSASTKEKKQDTAQTPEVNVPVTAPEITVSTPPGTAPATSCYSNEGLKYATVISISFGEENTISGDVSAQELGTDTKQTVKFSGTRSGNTLTVKFEGNPPVIGAASEWTTKPWTLKPLEGKGNTPETLHIPFTAKNYETNKWEPTEYIFAAVPCK